MLEIHNLNVSYGDAVAVRNLSLTAAPGEIVTLLGPTGCGKTTTLRVVAGLEDPSGGTVRINGREVSGGVFTPPEQRNTGLVFQDFALFPHLTVAQNVGFRLKRSDPVEHWLEWLGLAAHRDAYPENLSGGQKQRVALARCLAHQPELVLLDEPLSNLDASLKDSLRWEIRSALKEAGVPAVWVTHDQAEALSIGDRVGIMRDGELEQLDLPEECFRAPATRFVAEFLGEASFLPGQAGKGLVATALGQVPGNGGEGAVEALARPDDLGLEAAEDGNGVVAWARYEGGTRLFGVDLRSGPRVKIRTNHEARFEPGDPVRVAITAGHPLALFPAAEDHGTARPEPPRAASSSKGQETAGVAHAEAPNHGGELAAASRARAQ
ncbi:ABC transporter ATP-binding protein [Thiohalorhabdus sp. Cl-TMA]|uniref:ABC transporter ATP-binding protein n=1 Tax=Thiohalorhabdus methylotrophus TaxID=3242694 RepID=A0ABV4U0M6_9GAMM